MTCACPCCMDAHRYRAIRPYLKRVNYDAARWGIWMPEAPPMLPFPMPADADEAVDRLIASQAGT